MPPGVFPSIAQTRASTQQTADEEARASAPGTSRDESLLAVALILDRLHQTGMPVDDLEPALPDRCTITTREERCGCQECDRTVLTAYRYGHFCLCRRCVTRRLQLQERLTALPPATERAAA